MMNSIRPLILTLSLLGGVGIAVGGCNTVEGLGKDVTAGGKAVSGAAKKTKDKL